MQDLLYGLNERQKEAVTTTEGFVRVIAGAGSGKTGALTRRFAYLVCELGILPGNILCVTFTNKAANEMRSRIHRLTGDRDTGYINTFHGFCVSILQEDSHAVQYPKSFLVLDNSDIDAMLQDIYEERGLTLRDMTFGAARDMIEMRKLIKEPLYYRDMISMTADEIREKYLKAEAPGDIIFYGYLYREKKTFGLDYNDLIIFSLYIFKEHPDIRLKWQQRLQYIMIDEFQDIDRPQYELMEVLCGYHKNLFVVGDPDQTIYTWRGANVGYLLNFDRVFPDTKTILMMDNYRSTPQILNTANSVIDRNRDRMKKDLLPTLPDGEQVTWHHAKNDAEEAKYIADTIKGLMDRGIPCRSIAVLYRAHYLTRSLEEAFIKAQLPYTIYSGARFWDRKEIKDALSYLRMIVYKDDLSFVRVANTPKRNLGKRRMAFLKETAEREDCTLYEALLNHLEEEIFKGTRAKAFVDLIERCGQSYEGRTVSEVLSALLNDSGYEQMLRTEGSQERLDDLAELKQSVYEYELSCGEECTLPHYLNHIALFTNADTAEAGDRVKLMTVHTAKGLEFDRVFLCGMSEGIFPSRKVRTLPGMEEERRLCFVALTRAKKSLTLTDAEGRNLDFSPRYPSRFLLEAGKENLLLSGAIDPLLLEEARRMIDLSERLLPAEESGALATGTRVEHPVFGPGTVLDTDTDSGANLIQFDRMPTPRSIAFRVPLKVLETDE